MTEKLNPIPNPYLAFERQSHKVSNAKELDKLRFDRGGIYAFYEDQQYCLVGGYQGKFQLDKGFNWLQRGNKAIPMSYEDLKEKCIVYVMMKSEPVELL